MKNIKRKLIIIAGIIIILILGVVTIYNFIKINSGEWVCIAQECSEYYENDDWVKQNCELVGSEMICEFQYQGQNFRIPLSGVNVDDMVSCGEYTCASEVFVRGSLG